MRLVYGMLFSSSLLEIQEQLACRESGKNGDSNPVHIKVLGYEN
jgi:hypothetical protein